MKTDNKLIGAGLLTAIAASLCCITPVLALIAGTSGLASTFSWLEPFRPYFIGLTILVLGFAWYQKLKPKKQIDCNCETEEKPKFVNHEVNKLSGIIKSTASYESGNAIVEFDNSKTNISEIEKAINSTGYSVTDKKEN